MSNWSAGYVSDIDYIYGYFSELNPLCAELAFASQGIYFPKVENACELGFGQGLSLNIHASASEISWFGSDFIPSQASFAQSLARESENGASIYDFSFAEFNQLNELPNFDFIGLHGVWSWISDENRREICKFLKERLNVGGVVYMSYNTLPGWSAFAPIRHLLTEYASRLCSPGEGTKSSMDNAFEFTKELLAVDPAYLTQNPTVASRLKEVLSLNKAYLAHEYFNDSWHPMYFSNVEKLLEPTKLTYSCSAEFLDDLDNINLTEQQAAFLSNINDESMRQLLKDYMSNKIFRRDYWIKGKRRMGVMEQRLTLRNLNVALTVPRQLIEFEFTHLNRKVNLAPNIYEPVVDLLADKGVCTIEVIESKLSSKGIDLNHIVQCLLVLSARRQAQVVRDDDETARLKPSTDRINNILVQQSAEFAGPIRVLASPRTGGAVHIERFHQMFLRSVAKGKKDKASLAREAWDIMRSQNDKLVVDGVQIESEKDNLQKLEQEASAFLQERLPTFKVLGLV